MGWMASFTTFGIILILVGVTLILIPLLINLVPTMEVERIPWILLYVYRRDGFYFATSPLLLVISIIYLLWAFLHQ